MSVEQRRSPRQGRSAERVATILAATRELLQQQPESAVTIRAIADRAGTSPASVYRYFDDLDQVVDALVMEHSDIATNAVSGVLASSRHTTVSGVFVLVVRTYLDLYERRPELTLAWRSATMARRQQVIEEASDEGLAHLLGAHLRRRGLIDELTPQIESRLAADWTVAGTLLGLVLRAAPERRGDRVADLEALVRWFASRY